MHDLVDSGVESLTVGLINSYVNPRHEEEIGAIVERLYPGFPVTLSAHVLPEFREYERTLTACMNSYVRPRVANYVEQLQASLKSAGASSVRRRSARDRLRSRRTAASERRFVSQ